MTASDALLVAQNIISGALLNEAQVLAADLDGDGFLTMADAIKLMRVVLGL
ncbi:MAG: dockerin type I domain-containing protein [Clostridiales Family XIII bacterium]|nr:dockerin type I domain-containing protein [Clostridiales Family XIII bacterium]